MIRTLTVQRFRVARIPSDVALWLKVLLVAVLAVQGARLIWAAVSLPSDLRLFGVRAGAGASLASCRLCGIEC